MIISQRLARVAAALPGPQATPAWVQRMEAIAESSPVSVAIWRHARVRAQRRALAAGGNLTTPDDAAIEREWDELQAYVVANGEEAGLARWFAEAATWPAVLGWPNDLAAFWADVERQTAHLDGLRRSPALAAWRVRTGWDVEQP